MTGYDPRTLVFPTDFSACSWHAGRVAADIARRCGARVHLLHVEPPITGPAASSRLTAAARALGEGVDVTIATTVGTPAGAICAYAHAIGADLIVMGTHGRTGLSHALLGSVAEGVVRRARCPVMTIPAAGPAPADEMPHPANDSCCVVCSRPSPDLICQPCRAIIRGEALERNHAEEHAGRVGSPR
jgi:nucleotide-binding universal stress UspA family protein